MNRVCLFTKGVWFSENVCEGSPTQILIHCSSQLLIHLTEPLGWKTLLKYTLSSSEAEVLCAGIWGPRMMSWALLRLEIFTSSCEAQQLFVDIWDLQLRTSLYISRNRYISYFNSGTQSQLLMTQNVREWMVGLILQKSFSDAPKDTRTSLERLPRNFSSSSEIFTLA